MIETGIEPPKHLELDPTSKIYKWLLRLQSVFAKVQTFTVTIDPASVAASTTSEQSFTVNGLTTQDIITVNKPTHDAGLGIVNARVSAANTLSITYMNTTALAIDPSSEDYLIIAVRR